MGLYSDLPVYKGLKKETHGIDRAKNTFNRFDEFKNFMM
jgi:hypothetical protein